MTSAIVDRFESEVKSDNAGNCYKFLKRADLRYGENIQRMIELYNERQKLIDALRKQPQNTSRIISRGKDIRRKIDYIVSKFESDFEDYHYQRKTTGDMFRLWYGHTLCNLLNANIKTIVLNADNESFYIQFGAYSENLGKIING